jgi:hypothetical protein
MSTSREVPLCEVIAQIVVKSILISIQIVQDARHYLGDKKDYKTRLEVQIARLDDVQKLLKNPVIGNDIQPRDRHTYFNVMLELHRLLLDFVRTKGPQTDDAKRFYQDMSADDLFKELEIKDVKLSEPEVAQEKYWLRLSEKFTWSVFQKKGAEKLIVGVERWGDCLDTLLSATIPSTFIRTQLTSAQIKKTMPSGRLLETKIKSEILVEKKKEAEEMINSMQGLSLGASSTELQYSRIRLLQEPSTGGKKVFKDGDENDEDRTDLGGASRRQWAQLLDGHGNVRDGRVIVEFKERPLIRDDTRITEVRKELRSLVRVLRLASQNGQESQLFQVLFCEGFYETPDHYGIVYQLPSSPSYSVCESLGNILLKPEYHQLLGVDLENRLLLAKALAYTMYNIHSVQWVHKSFNPDNILLFGTRSSDGAITFDWANPYVVGFDASRANLAHSDKLSASLRWENRAYTHPERQREGEVKRFSKTFDIYSLGVVLLEIGLMKCFKHSSYRKAAAWTDIPARQVQDRFLSLAGDLKGLVGKTYSEVVAACLTGFPSVIEDDDSHGTDLLAAFRSQVCEKFDYVRY